MKGMWQKMADRNNTIKIIRDISGHGMEDCAKAYDWANGDGPLAVGYLEARHLAVYVKDRNKWELDRAREFSTKYTGKFSKKLANVDIDKALGDIRCGREVPSPNGGAVCCWETERKYVAIHPDTVETVIKALERAKDS